MIKLRTWLRLLITFYTFCDVRSIQYVYDSLSVPCSFWNSVNITDGMRLSNGSYLHDGRLYPEVYVGTFDYAFVNLTLKISVKPHLRGCICSMATCVRLCCPKGQYFDDRAKECRKPSLDVDSMVNVTNAKGGVDIVNIGSKFEFVYGKPCELMYYLDPATFDYDKWELFQKTNPKDGHCPKYIGLKEKGHVFLDIVWINENGTILRWDDLAYVSKDDYCLSPTLSVNSSVMVFNPYVCFPSVGNTRFFIYGIAMLTSVPFLIITILVYLIIPELRNLHGKALCCYLSCLVVGYSALGHILIEGGVLVTDPMCEVLGYAAYFSFMSSFLWLSVISFDLWWNFRMMTARGSKRELKRFILYSVYAWGLSLCFTVTIYLVQKSNVADVWKPGIGGGQFCWLDSTSWVQMLYFYGQIIIIISFNISMFIMTTYKIHHVKKETSKIMGREDSRRNINREKDNVGLFLRLFIVMGVTWSMELIAWLLGKRFEFLFYITDTCNAIQGLIIFILFVMKNKIKQLMVKRYNSIRGQGKDTRASQYSTKTSSMAMTTTPTSTSALDKTEITLIPVSEKSQRDSSLRK